MSEIRVLIADDHRLVRATIARFLATQPDMVVVGEAADAYQVQEAVSAHQPDVVLMDIRMPGPSGIEATSELRRRGSAARVVILTALVELAEVRAAFAAGAIGYVTKLAEPSSLLRAIRHAHRGLAYLDTGTPGAGLDLASVRRPARPPHLSTREAQVLRQSALGYTSREIGQALHLSAKTIESYRERVKKKLGLRRRADLVTYAFETGLLRGESPQS